MVALSDEYQLHRRVLVGAYAISVACRLGMAWASSFPLTLALTVGGELCWGPMVR